METCPPRQPAALSHRAGIVFWSLCAAGCWLAGTAAAVLPPGTFETYESRSRQFVVTGVKTGTPVPLPPVTDRAATNYVLLETPVVVANCERIKDAWLRELGLADHWRSAIRVQLVPNASPDTPVTVEKQWFPERWKFTLYAPHQIEPVRFVRGVVWALLLELANRDNPTQTAAEIPLWLVEGLTTHVIATSGASVLMTPRSLTHLSSRAPDFFGAARANFKTQAPLSFSDLNLPREHQVSGAGWENYRHSAHVLVAHLLNFKDGRERLAETVRQLPRFLNPQLAFLQAWRERFNSMLDVEKWWSVALVHFTGRDQQLRWSQAASLQRLEELLRTTIEVRTGKNTLPERAQVPLQRMLEQSEFANHQAALAHLTQQLLALQWNAPADLSRLVGDYRATIFSYLQKRGKEEADTRGKAPPGNKVTVRDTVQQLDLLDIIREDFRKADLAEAGAGPGK